MPGFHGEAALVGCQAGCLICGAGGQLVEVTALPSPATPTATRWTPATGQQLLTWQEVKYELSNLSLVLREHFRSCGCAACATTDQWMAISSGSVEPSNRALVGCRRSRGWSVSLGLSTVRSRVGELCYPPSQPDADWAARPKSVAARAQLWPKARVLSPLARGTTGGVQTDLVTPCRKKRGEAERARLK